MTFIQPQDLPFLPHPFFIVTEGMGDARFVDELLQLNQITNCGVGCPSTKSAGGTGKNAFPKYTLAVQGARTRVQSVPLQGLLAVADANGDAKKSFDAVANALDNAQFPKPNNAFEIVEANGFRVAVYMIPGAGQTGTLEHLLLRAVFKKSPILEQCLNEFSICSGGLYSRDPNSDAKMRMSVLAGAFCDKHPWTPVSNIWSEPANPVPITSDEFNHLTEFIRRFSAVNGNG